MATVTGVLSDISDVPLTANPIIVFYPDRPGTNATSYTAPGGTERAAGGSIFATAEVRATPSGTGFFTVNLFPSSGMLGVGGEVKYNARLEWLDAGGKGNFIDVITGLVVPPSGGTIGNLLAASPGASLIWVGATAPPNTRRGTRWLYTGTTNATYTNSHLYEWR